MKRLNSPKDVENDTFFRVTFEQSVFRDATCSAMVGRPRFYHRCACMVALPCLKFAEQEYLSMANLLETALHGITQRVYACHGQVLLA